MSPPQARIARPTMRITTRSSNPDDAATGAGCGARTERGRTGMGGLSAIRSLLVIIAASRLSADVREPLRVVNGSRNEDVSVNRAPHGRAEPPSFQWPVNSVWATLRYSSSPVGGIELLGGSAGRSGSGSVPRSCSSAAQPEASGEGGCDAAGALWRSFHARCRDGLAQGCLPPEARWAVTCDKD
jgi:hypothetical protein